jgi:hypothetical protein
MVAESIPEVWPTSALESGGNLVYEEDKHECSEEPEERKCNATTEAREIFSVYIFGSSGK